MEMDQQKQLTKQVLASVENVGIRIAPWSEQSGDTTENKHQYAVCFGEYVVLLAKQNQAKPSVYIEGQEWRQLEKTTALDHVDVVLYAKDGQYKGEGGKIFLPASSSGFPVFVVEFRRNQEPTVFIGEYKNGKVINKDGKIYGTSLVFGRNGGEFIPLGIYDSKEESLISLDLSIANVVFFNEKQAINHKQGAYVLSNDTMQLVIDSSTGSVSEINLPFVSTSPESIVQSIEADKELEEQVPSEATFPLASATNFQGQQAEQVVGGYYPLLRREATKGKAHQHALNIVSGEEMAPWTSGFRVTRFDQNTIQLESTDGKVRKTYTLLPDQPYAFELSVWVANTDENLWITSGVPEAEILSNAFSPAIKYREVRKNKKTLEAVKLPKSKHPLQVQKASNVQWMMNSNGYFGVIITPMNALASEYATQYIPGNVMPTRLSFIPPKNQQYPASKYPGYQTFLSLNHGEKEQKFLVYAGPLAEPTLKALEKAQEKKNGENLGYLEILTLRGFFAFIAEPFAALLFIIMKFFKAVTGSWGISIILLTVFLKVVLYPLNAWSIRSMRRMQKLSPYIQEIQQKYKKEPKRAQMEVMALYKANKVNPITGCFPLLIQLPFLIAMFDLLKSSFLLRGVPFIPGWIDNLTAPDVIFSWDASIPFIGKELHLLPILLGLVMFAQQRLATLKRQGPITDQQRQQDAMGTMMAILFTIMFYKFPSGLNIYWLSSMVLGIVQQWATNKLLDRKHLKQEVVLNKKK